MKSADAFEKRKMAEFLAREMGQVWTGRAPPSAPLATEAVMCGTFLSLNMKAPLLEEALKGRKLTDLGAGEPHGMMVFADDYGASEYVGVDRYRDYEGFPEFLRASLVNADMLVHLSSQPDCSTNIAMVAIDEVVLMHDSRVIEDAYSEMLLREIARVVPHGGVAFGLSSPILHRLSGFGFERIESTGSAHVGVTGAIYMK